MTEIEILTRQPCESCGGSGIRSIRHIHSGEYQDITCPNCNGKGGQETWLSLEQCLRLINHKKRPDKPE